jgi:hypothetical protein
MDRYGACAAFYTKEIVMEKSLADFLVSKISFDQAYPVELDPLGDAATVP